MASTTTVHPSPTLSATAPHVAAASQPPPGTASTSCGRVVPASGSGSAATSPPARATASRVRGDKAAGAGASTRTHPWVPVATPTMRRWMPDLPRAD
jgi:hypothetical protein